MATAAEQNNGNGKPSQIKTKWLSTADVDYRTLIFRSPQID